MTNKDESCLTWGVKEQNDMKVKTRDYDEDNRELNLTILVATDAMGEPLVNLEVYPWDLVESAIENTNLPDAIATAFIGRLRALQREIDSEATKDANANT